jgi:hypothetical protein
MDVMRQDHAFLPQNVRQKNVDNMRRKTSIYVRFAVRAFCGVTRLSSSFFFSSFSCLLFSKELKTSYMPEQSCSSNDHRKNFMINHNENDRHRPGIELGSFDPHTNTQPLDPTGRCPLICRLS